MVMEDIYIPIYRWKRKVRMDRGDMMIILSKDSLLRKRKWRGEEEKEREIMK
jgi:hypothetical protein